MAKMLVVVNKLNRRKSPVTDFADKTNVVGILNRDSVFESVDEISNSLGNMARGQGWIFLLGRRAGEGFNLSVEY